MTQQNLKVNRSAHFNCWIDHIHFITRVVYRPRGNMISYVYLQELGVVGFQTRLCLTASLGLDSQSPWVQWSHQPARIAIRPDKEQYENVSYIERNCADMPSSCCNAKRVFQSFIPC